MLVALGAAALIVSTPAAAGPIRTIKLNWTERTVGSRPPMTFKVTSVTLARHAWSVRATITNRSRAGARIRSADERAFPHQYNFAVAWFNSCPPHAYSCERGINSWPSLHATYAKPALPKELGPGESWSGVFGGPGLPPQGKLIYVTFGTFVFRSQGTAVGWITNGSFKR